MQELLRGTAIDTKPGYVLKSYLIQAGFLLYCARAARSKIEEDGREICR